MFICARDTGFCFVEFSEPQYAEAAMAMDGFELKGRKVGIT
jgi:RNA recognition motif-containing protein